MEEDQEGSLVRAILRGVSPCTAIPDRIRLLKARLRGLGDEIGEPILADPNEVPAHYVVLELPVQSSLPFLPRSTMTVAMTPRAAEAILARS